MTTPDWMQPQWNKPTKLNEQSQPVPPTIDEWIGRRVAIPTLNVSGEVQHHWPISGRVYVRFDTHVPHDKLITEAGMLIPPDAVGFRYYGGWFGYSDVSY